MESEGLKLSEYIELQGMALVICFAGPPIADATPMVIFGITDDEAKNASNFDLLNAVIARNGELALAEYQKLLRDGPPQA